MMVRHVCYCGDASDLERLEWRLGGVDGVLIPRSGTVRDTQAEVKVEDPVDVKSRGTDLLKRVFDVVASAVLMLVFSPMALLSAIAIKLEDGGDIIYAQERIGKDGKPFLIYKFRSMRMQADYLFDCATHQLMTVPQKQMEDFRRVLELQGKIYVVVGLLGCIFARARVPRAWLERI